MQPHIETLRKPASQCVEPETGATVHLQLDNNLKHTARTTLEWLQAVLQWPSQGSRLKPHTTSEERPENGSSQMIPIQSDSLRDLSGIMG